MTAYSLSEISELQAFYRKTLLEDVIPFWMKHGVDRVHGGFITSLDRDGAILDTDKSVWFQGRGVGMRSSAASFTSGTCTVSRCRNTGRI